MNESIAGNALAQRPERKHLSPAQRWLSLAELALGSAIVIGHNVYHVIPNEVPILFVLGLVSLRLRDGGWGVMGLHWPVLWRRTILFALAAAAVRILLGALVIDPITAHFWPAAIRPNGSELITGHVTVAIRWLVIVWTFAAFGEEIGYRGYLLTRQMSAADPKLHTGPASWWSLSCSPTGTITKVLRGWWIPAWLASFLVQLTCCQDATCGLPFWRTGSLTHSE
jgi:hypothetical protein